MLNPVQIPAMDITDYADMLSYLSDFAEALELEATYGPGGGHPVTEAAHKASLLLRRAEALLRPLAVEAEITAAEKPPGCKRCGYWHIFDRASGLCETCSADPATEGEE